MVWSILNDISFSQGGVLRAADMNRMIDGIYRLAPNYWREAGDLAVGDSLGVLQRLPKAPGNGYYLVNSGSRGVEWSANALLRESDLIEGLRGSASGMSIMYAHNPTRLFDYGFIRNSGNSYDRVISRDAIRSIPFVRIVNGRSSAFTLTRSGESNELIMLNSNYDLEYRVIAHLHYDIPTFHTFVMDSISDLENIFSDVRTVSPSYRQGVWRSDPGGSATVGSGPSPNNTLGFVTTTTNLNTGNTHDSVYELGGVLQFISLPLGSDRQVRLRVCIQGDFDNGLEGLEIQERILSTDSWNRAGFIYGWRFVSSRIVGDIFTDYNGNQRIVVANGGWIDVTIPISDSASQVRLQPRYVNAETGDITNPFRKNVALREVEWSRSLDEGPPVLSDFFPNLSGIDDTYSFLYTKQYMSASNSITLVDLTSILDTEHNAILFVGIIPLL